MSISPRELRGQKKELSFLLWVRNRKINFWRYILINFAPSLTCTHCLLTIIVSFPSHYQAANTISIRGVSAYPPRVSNYTVSIREDKSYSQSKIPHIQYFSGILSWKLARAPWTGKRQYGAIENAKSPWTKGHAGIFAIRFPKMYLRYEAFPTLIGTGRGKWHRIWEWRSKLVFLVSILRRRQAKDKDIT